MTFPSVNIIIFFSVCFCPQGLNPGKAIAEIKKMMATYREKKAAAVWNTLTSCEALKFNYMLIFKMHLEVWWAWTSVVFNTACFWQQRPLLELPSEGWVSHSARLQNEFWRGVCVFCVFKPPEVLSPTLLCGC